MAYSARLLATNQLQDPVEDIAHGFSVGNVLRWDGAAWQLAQANSEANAEVVGITTNIADVDHFFISQMGHVSNIPTSAFDPVAPATPGEIYYLSPTAPGKLTATKPTAVGQVELPCFIAYGADNGYFFASVGDLITSGALFAWTVVVANQALAVNNGYFTNAGGVVSLSLPAAFGVGDTIKVSAHSAGGWTITQGAGQQIFDLAGSTTLGAGGSLSSTAQGDSIELVGVVANTTLRIVSSKGALAFV